MLHDVVSTRLLLVQMKQFIQNGTFYKNQFKSTIFVEELHNFDLERLLMLHFCNSTVLFLMFHIL